MLEGITPMEPIRLTDSLVVRRAGLADLPAIVRLHASDMLGSTREHLADPLPASYVAAFQAIDADPRTLLVVAEDDGGIVGTLQLTLLYHITYQGALRAQLEAVQIDQRVRGRGLGRVLVGWAIEYARAAGCYLIELTSHASRDGAHRFYEQLGFTASHVGMKLKLQD
jgi:GNAT superfamily N-acetyltransferase